MPDPTLERLRNANPITETPQVPDSTLLLEGAREREDGSTGKSRSRRGWVLGSGAAIALAAVGTVILLSSNSPVSVVGQAEAALAPTGSFVHYVADVSAGSTEGSGLDTSVLPSSCQQPGPTEVWQTSAPMRWRVVSVSPKGPCGPNGFESYDPRRDRMEEAYSDGKSSTYLPRDQTLRIAATKAPETGPRVPIGGFSDIDRSDPVESLRAMLASGKLTDRGARMRDGKPVRTLAGMRIQTSRGQTFRETIVYDVDPDSFMPVRALRVYEMLPAPGRARGPANLRRGFELKFRSYEHRPFDAKAAEQLKIRIAPGTRTVRTARP